MIRKLLSSITVSIIAVAMLLTFSFLKMIFSTKDPGKYFTYFNTLFFENTLNTDGSLTMTFGFTGDLLPIIVSVVIGTILIMLFLNFHTMLLNRKKKLSTINNR